jgi:hypothetical protein
MTSDAKLGLFKSAMLVRVWLIQEAAGSDGLLRVPSSRLSQYVLINKPRSRTRHITSTTLDSRKAQTAEKQPLNLFEGPLPWKIFISLLKSTCSFEKERYFRTPFFRKEKR